VYEDFVFQQDPGSLMLEYMVPGEDGSTAVGERRFNWVWYLKADKGPALDAVLTDIDGHRRRRSIAPGRLSKAQDAYLRGMGAQRANPAFRELIEKTEDIFVQVIEDFQVPRMVFDRVLLTADAAFIPRPHTAGSSAKAAKNAHTLARTLRDTPDLDSALATWERQALLDGARMVDWGIRMGDQIMDIKG